MMTPEKKEIICNAYITKIVTKYCITLKVSERKIAKDFNFLYCIISLKDP